MSPPSIAAMKGASGFKTLFICASSDGKSLTQCMLIELITASNVLASYGNSSSSTSTSRVRFISLLNGRSASRYSIVWEESAAVRCANREDRGGEVSFEGSKSGSGSVSARAMLHELAPRSRTWLKWRLIS